MRTFVGTSGYNYDEWQGRFYPDKLAKAKRLPYYASRFEAVEINYTYYRFPSEKALAGWAAETPPGFRFALKAWQGITHQRRLKEAAEPARDFLQRVATLGDKLGPVLFGLPPNLPRDLPRLQAFLAALPREAACAFEFRHPSWLDDTVYAALVEAGVALCVADSEDLETPFLRTAPFGYLRLRRPDYDERALDAWAERIRCGGFSGDVHVYFKHEDAARGVAFAEGLVRRLAV